MVILDDKSDTLRPLPEVLSRGLVAVSTFGLLSFFCSTTLFLFLTYKIIRWRVTATEKTPLNQFLFLIYNLLLADIQQAMAFLLNIRALSKNSIVVGDSTCWAQGWFISTGDLASSLFIFAIGLHTFLSVVKSYQLPTWAFHLGVAGLWLFNYVLGVAGPLMHPGDFYVRASAWCWVNNKYQAERLWLHYFWIFILMFSTILIYAFTFVYLRSRSRSSHENISTTSAPSGHGATPLMILYPLIYVVCTSPLAIGRIVSLTGTHVSLAYFCVAGTMISCNGWLDVLLYASTRSDIVFSEFPPNEETGLETFAFLGKGHRMGNVTTIQGGHQRTSSRLRRGESVENLYGLDQIHMRGEVTVSTERVKVGDVRTSYKGTTAHVGQKSWDSRSAKSVKSTDA